MVETREVKKRLERSCSSFPDFVESDGESDKKDSLCEEPQFESGGDEGASVERDMWADYPAQKLDNEFKSDAQTPAHAAEELLLIRLLIWVVALMGKVGDLVVSIYARWAKSKYHQESGRLCGEYRKRLAKRRQQADALMLQSKMEIPMVEALMACPLLKFIHFAANDCGYIGTRYKLIANWVHPLFLKAKSEASKEDNLSWKQAMNGPFKEEYWRAAVKEFETLKAMDAWEVVDRREAENVI